MTTTLTWNTPIRLPDGHRLFYQQDRIAIADNSGRTPDQTSDGVMWLDRSRPLIVSGHNCFIPIVSEEGRNYSTPTDFATVLHMSETFDWTISLRDIEFKASRA